MFSASAFSIFALLQTWIRSLLHHMWCFTWAAAAASRGWKYAFISTVKSRLELAWNDPQLDGFKVTLSCCTLFPSSKSVSPALRMETQTYLQPVHRYSRSEPWRWPGASRPRTLPPTSGDTRRSGISFFSQQQEDAIARGGRWKKLSDCNFCPLFIHDLLIYVLTDNRFALSPLDVLVLTATAWTFSFQTHPKMH